MGTLAERRTLDSETNLRLIENPPLAFQAPDGDVGETNLFAVVTPNSVFPPTPMTKVLFKDVSDGLGSTLMLIELPNRSVPWTSTENITPDEAFAAISELQGIEVAHVLMSDGAVRAVTRDLDRETFDAMITRDGGEVANLAF